MKKILLVLITIFMLAGCFGEDKSNPISEVNSTEQLVNGEKGTLYISGTWPGSLQSSEKSNAKMIPNNTAGLVVTLTNDSYEQPVTSTVTNDGSGSFTVSIPDLIVGDWTVTVKAQDSDGTEITTTKPKTITITTNNNFIATVFPPNNYAELFYTIAVHYLVNDYVRWFDMLAALDIEKIDIYKREAYYSNDYLIDRFEYSRLMMGTMYEYAGETIATPTSSGIIVDGYGEGTKVAQLTTTYNSSDQIESATYTNNGTEIVSGTGINKGFTVNFTMTYNADDDRLNTLDILGQVDGITTYEETEDFYISNGNYRGSNISAGEEKLGGVYIEYSNNEVVSRGYGKTGEQVLIYNFIWNDGKIEIINNENYFSNLIQKRRTEITYDSTDVWKPVSEESFVKETSGNDDYYFTEKVDYKYETETGKTHLLEEKTVNLYTSTDKETPVETKRVFFTYDTNDRVTKIDYYYTDSYVTDELIFSEELHYRNEN